jgi:hypothetical protein
MLKYEIPRTMRSGLFLKLKGIGDYITIYSDDMKLPQGGFSTISNSLMLNISDEEIFYGACEPKKN